MNKHKHRLSLQRKASMRLMRPFRGAKGLTRPVAVRAPSGLSYPVRGALGRSLAER